MGVTQASAPPLVEATAPSTPYRNAGNQQSLAAEVVEAAATGQNFYIRAVERTFLHRFSLFINLLTIIGAIGLAIGQIWGMAIKNMNWMEVMMRSYLMAIAGMIILNECETSAVLQNSPILNKYPWRGLFYTFIGTLGTMLNDLGNDDYQNNWNRNRYNYNNGYNNNSGYITFQIPSLEHAVEIFIQISSIQIFLLGIVYFIMGMCFLQKKVQRDIEAYRMRLAMCERDFGGHQDVVRRRIGGRLGEEIGIAAV